MVETLPLVFAAVLVAAIAIYVCLDGMDLGIGIVFLFAPREADRDLMMATIEPVWDGNETWLVLGAMVLFAGFPTALAALLPALYVPLMAMLFCLVLRGIAFEFRGHAERSRRLWNIIFSIASLGAALCQGLVLGTYVGGVIVPGQTDTFAFLSWFSIVTALGLAGGYALLGATWLVWRTAGSTQVFAREIAQPALLCVALFIGVVSVWTPVAQPLVAARWFSWPAIGYLAPVPVLTALAWFGVWRTLWRPRDHLPYMLAVALFMLGLIGLCVSIYPYAVPGHLTLWDAASRPATLALTGIGLLICLPVIGGYMVFSYWVFRGKVTSAKGY